MLIRNGIPTPEDLAKVMPSEARLNKGPVAVCECFQCIPCNPCSKACPKNAITVEPDINQIPVIDEDLCIGCGLCVAACPGLALFVVDMTYSEDEALVTIPFEFWPVPEKGQFAEGLDRSGVSRGWFRIVRVVQGRGQNKTWMITLAVPKDLAMEIRNIRVGGYRDERE